MATKRKKRDSHKNSRAYAVLPKGRFGPSARTALGKSVRWSVGLVVAAVATLIIGALTGIPAQLFDLDVLKDRLRRGPDLSISTEVIFLDDEGRSMVTQGDYRPSEHVQRLMSQPGAAVSPYILEQIRAAGGVNLERLTLRLIVKGNRNQEVRILDIRPVVREHTAPLAGTLFDIPPQAGKPTMRMIIDLDQADPIAREIGEFDPNTGKELPGQPFFENTTISLRDREQEVLIIRTVATQYHVAFDLQVRYRIGDRDKTVLVTDQGQPFRISGLHSGPEPNTLSYERAFELDTGFSLCPVKEPRRIATFGNPRYPEERCSQDSQGGR